MAPLCHSLRFRYSLVSVCIECLAVPSRARPARGFVCSAKFRRIIHQRCLPRSCDSAAAKLFVRNFVDAIPRVIYVCIYMPHLHFSAIPRRNDYPTRCIAFLSDRYRADSFRSIFYRYFEILEAVAFFPKFDSHGLNSYFEILMRARQDTLLVHVIRVDVLVFIPPRIAFFADNGSAARYI